MGRAIFLSARFQSVDQIPTTPTPTSFPNSLRARARVRERWGVVKAAAPAAAVEAAGVETEETRKTFLCTGLHGWVMRRRRIRLHLAAWAGHVEVVRCLCKHKADVGAAAMDDTAAIHFASQKGHVEVVRELLASGASVKAKNRKGLTALHLAAQNSHLDLVKYLVKKGSDITTKTKGGQTALHVAENDDVRAFLKECEQSLKKGAELTSVKKDDVSTTAEKADDNKSSSEVTKDGDDVGQGEKRKSDGVAGSSSSELKKAKVSLGHLVSENDDEEEE
ncbi:hypothetical protein PR202_gb07606 [Eleusine coracana subsp. coracana]|uniref:Uncharacterized protein n=1 Tax=Eleusine coracana subsp. coracana TaxID=191504 RepID=A0AAV5EDH2_ELECO|nr:hypothetical protein PR202_gb07606 [Eleusine coracana subsp. coracana]